MSELRPPKAFRTLRLGLPKTDRVAFGILHPRECAGGNVDGRNQRLCAKALCLFEVRGDVIDAHVENGVALRLVSQRGNVAVDAAHFGRNHRRGTHLRDFPIKQFFVKVLRLGDVSATDFEMHDGVGHWFGSCSMVWWLRANGVLAFRQLPWRQRLASPPPGAASRHMHKGSPPHRSLLREKRPGHCTTRSEEHTSELQSRLHLVCRLLLEKKKKQII